jgi:organic hydroperoxide reductase OsmC/OhrA
MGADHQGTPGPGSEPAGEGVPEPKPVEPEPKPVKPGGVPEPEPVEPEVVRTARISWLTHPPGGHAGVSVGSRAFMALPLSFTGGDAEMQVTSPGELLAAAHGSAVAVLLARILTRDGTPAHELVVAATYTFAGEWYRATALQLSVEGRVPGSDQPRFELAAREAVDRSTESFGTPEGSRITLLTRLL